MRTLLYLTHRLPYPPNKGDKIPSFKMLEYLSKYFKIYLGTFIDDQHDWQYVSKVEQYCKDTCVVGLNSNKAKLKSLIGFLTGQPLSIPYYKNDTLQRWVNQVLSEQKPDAVLMYSGVTAQFISGKVGEEVKTLLDLIDVDSDKWRQYADRHSWPMSWVYRRESRTLLEYEKQMAREFDNTMLVSKNEAELFKGFLPSEIAEKVHWRTQGVDADYFDPEIKSDSPYPEGSKVIVFTGVMNYWTNIDAVTWFAQGIFPKIRKQLSDVNFYIVGRYPDQKVKALESLAGVKVTGGVEDIRPYLKYAHLVVAPFRQSRGVKNKVLEAMAMAKPVVGTSLGFSGIQSFDKRQLIAESEDDFAQVCIDQLAELEGSMDLKSAPEARELVLKHYNWEESLKKIRKLLE